MNDDDMKKMQYLLQQMFGDFLRHQQNQQAGHYCQRCEEYREGSQFSTQLPVCDVCAETMPKQELIELSNSIR